VPGYPSRQGIAGFRQRQLLPPLQHAEDCAQTGFLRGLAARFKGGELWLQTASGPPSAP